MVYIKLNGFEMKFICFYTKNSVCAVKPITAEEIANADTEYKTLELFNSVVFTKECDDFLLEVQRDGQWAVWRRVLGGSAVEVAAAWLPAVVVDP